MSTFNGALYVGTGVSGTGYSVYKVTNTSTTPFGFTQLVPNGGGRGAAITSVVSMQPFKGRLYIGANGWGQGGSFASEEIRINPDDTWDLVVGAARTLPGGTVKSPISGLPDGFGNFFNAHFWRAEVHNGALYIGTNDASSAWGSTPPLGSLLAPEFGFDVWGTCDGQYWWQVTRNAFGDGRWNFGARTLVSSPFGLFIGSTNHVEGTSIWKGDASPCGAGGAQFGAVQRVSPSKSTGRTSPATAGIAVPAPTRLLTDTRACGTVLSWDEASGAQRYRILRAEYRSVNINLKGPPKLPNGGYFADATPTPAPSGTGKLKRISVAGPYVAIGTTTESAFVDRTATQGTRYYYQVVAESASGEASRPSNVAAAPSQLPKVTFAELNAAIARLSKSTGAGRTANLVRFASIVQSNWKRDNGPSLRTLAQLREELDAVAGRVRRTSDVAAMNDVRDAVFQLERRANLDAACKR
jgi:hypothetical protein